MMKKLVSWCLLAVLGLSLCLSAPAEEASASLCFNKTVWGMGKAQVRWLMGVKPYQEPVGMTGYAVLVYRTKVEGYRCVMQYAFVPGDALDSMEIIVDDGDVDFYDLMNEKFTEQYGEPLTEDQADPASENVAAAVMAECMRTVGGEDFLAWQADGETVIVMCLNDVGCYVEFMRCA